MKNLKITFFIICILGVLFALTGCTKQEVTKEQNNEVSTSDNEIYLETLKLMYEEKDKEAYNVISKHEDSKDKYIQYLLGDFYYYGYGVEPNYETAFKYYKKSAEQGYDKAERKVGFCYGNGTGVEKNNLTAIEWYKKAADKGNISALNGLAWIYIYGEDGVEANYEEAMRIGNSLLEEENSDDGQHIIGYLYDYGYGVEKNDTTAFSWYLKSAEQGNEICQYNVGMFYSEGIGTEQNRDIGKQWLEKSALQGYEDALEYLMKNF